MLQNNVRFMPTIVKAFSTSVCRVVILVRFYQACLPPWCTCREKLFLTSIFSVKCTTPGVNIDTDQTLKGYSITMAIKLTRNNTWITSVQSSISLWKFSVVNWTFVMQWTCLFVHQCASTWFLAWLPFPQLAVLDSRLPSIPLQLQVFIKVEITNCQYKIRLHKRTLHSLEPTSFNILWYFRRILNFSLHRRAKYSEVVESACLHFNRTCKMMHNNEMNWDQLIVRCTLVFELWY